MTPVCPPPPMVFACSRIWQTAVLDLNISRRDAVEFDRRIFCGIRATDLLRDVDAEGRLKIQGGLHSHLKG